jgi:hypothetical protein
MELVLAPTRSIHPSRHIPIRFAAAERTRGAAADGQFSILPGRAEKFLQFLSQLGTGQNKGVKRRDDRGTKGCGGVRILETTHAARQQRRM